MQRFCCCRGAYGFLQEHGDVFAAYARGMEKTARNFSHFSVVRSFHHGKERFLRAFHKSACVQTRSFRQGKVHEKRKSVIRGGKREEHASFRTDEEASEQGFPAEQRASGPVPAFGGQNACAPAEKRPFSGRQRGQSPRFPAFRQAERQGTLPEPEAGFSACRGQARVLSEAPRRAGAPLRESRNPGSDGLRQARFPA